MRHRVWRPVISRRSLQRASIFIKTNESNSSYMYHYVSYGTLQWFFRLMKTNNENAFLYKFLKIFKGPPFHRQKFLDVKSMWESSNLYELLTSIIKTGGLFIRYFAKAVRKPSKSKNEKSKSRVFDSPSNLYEKFSKIHL